MIEILDGTYYTPSARAIVDLSGTAEYFTPPSQVANVHGHKIAPWGCDNDLPQRVIDLVAKNDITSSNINFNVMAAYGQGIIPMLRTDNGMIPCDNDDVLRFFDDNDINGYFLEQINDLIMFGNVFPELTLNKEGSKIVRLAHLEAAFSRWGSMAASDNSIKYHYYYHKWGKSVPQKGEWRISEVLNPTFTIDDLRMRALRGRRRFVMRIVMPTPGRTYYSRPSWWSIFESGTYELSATIPQAKLALLKNILSVRHIIYISNNYWADFLSRSGISTSDKEAVNKAKQEEGKRIAEFVSDPSSRGGTLLTSKDVNAMGKAIEDKYIEIETIKSTSDGELIKDSEEASNIICYAMGVHPSLIGATPGKNAGSLGGSDKRELFMVKQALLRPYRDRLLMPLNLIKRFNNWPDNLVFALPEYQFPTLDKSASGQQTVIQNAQ